MDSSTHAKFSLDAQARSVGPEFHGGIHPDYPPKDMMKAMEHNWIRSALAPQLRGVMSSSQLELNAIQTGRVLSNSYS